jgi:hypothetical protein
MRGRVATVSVVPALYAIIRPEKECAQSRD